MTSAAQLRRLFPAPRHKHPCFVCGKWASIAHWHHAPPLEEVAASLGGVQEERLRGFEWPLFSLCPNHHALWHRISRARQAFDSPMVVLRDMAELGPEERGRIEEIQAAEREAWGVLTGPGAEPSEREGGS
jgi:hypothetical protein